MALLEASEKAADSMRIIVEVLKAKFSLETPIWSQLNLKKAVVGAP